MRNGDVGYEWAGRRRNKRRKMECGNAAGQINGKWGECWFSERRGKGLPLLKCRQFHIPKRLTKMSQNHRHSLWFRTDPSIGPIHRLVERLCTYLSLSFLKGSDLCIAIS
jgi:hypothetical protein